MFAGLIGVLLLAWFLLSILNQFSFAFMAKFAAGYDRWLLLPRWTFFAPNPGCTDYRLLYRDFDDREQASEWSEVPLVRRRGHWDAIWNPDKRRSKGLFDLAQSLLILRHEHDNPAVAMTSIPYVALAHYVDCLPRGPGVKYRQFIIVQTHGIFADAGPELLMHSGVHRVCN